MSGKALIAYGKGRVELSLAPEQAEWTLITPSYEAPLEDPKADFMAAARRPIGPVTPLPLMAKPGDRVVIVTADGTRPVPNKQLIPWIVEALGVADNQVEILLGTGTHRPNTAAEIEEMFGTELPQRFRITNHDSFDANENVRLGRTSDGGEVYFNRRWVEADVRICVGFIEPHFFAGFSGGGKGIMPGIAGIDTILHYHRFDIIADPNSAYAVTEGNPTQQLIRECSAMCPPHFLVNVALNTSKQISKHFLGHWHDAHAAGCAHVKQHAMAAVDEAFPVVVVSNTGYPLDQNLYQSVKALAVAARIVKPGGTIVLVSECSDGLPDHGKFGTAMSTGLPPAKLLEQMRATGNPAKLDQWQVQTLLNVLMKCEVAIYSALPESVARRCHLSPVTDLERAIGERLERLPAKERRVAVLPDGPLTVPYIRGG